MIPITQFKTLRERFGYNYVGPQWSPTDRSGENIILSNGNTTTEANTNDYEWDASLYATLSTLSKAKPYFEVTIDAIAGAGGSDMLLGVRINDPGRVLSFIGLHGLGDGFQVGETLTGLTSGAHGRIVALVISAPDGDATLNDLVGTFDTAGNEEIAANDSPVTYAYADSIANQSWLNAGTYAFYRGTGLNSVRGGFTASGTAPAAYIANDIIGWAFDLQNGKIWTHKNGTWNNSGNPVTGANPTFSTQPAGAFRFIMQTDNSAGLDRATFRSSPAYSIPSGYRFGIPTGI